ncbi:MAG: LexA family transcriptional regulator [Bacteroidales bacterium]
MPKFAIIKDILDERGITLKNFCSEIGMSESGLKRIIKHNSTRIQTVETIAKALNIPIGILFGENPLNNSQIETSKRRKDKLPHIPFGAQAGSLSGFSSGVQSNECDYLDSIPSLGAYDFTIDVKGDSMRPEYESGDIVACRIIREVTDVKYGKIYVLDTAQGVVMKQLFESEQNPDSFLCVSLNPLYEPYLLPKEELFCLSRVVGAIKPAKD